MIAPRRLRRVVITGVGITSPLGGSLEAAMLALREGRHGIQRMPDFACYDNLSCLVAAPISHELPKYPRKEVRTMGRLGLLSVYATEAALREAKIGQELLSSGRLGLAYGSTNGATSEVETFFRPLLIDKSFAGIPGSAFPKFMSHTCAANLAQRFSIRGCVLPLISACTSASQSIGAAFDCVRWGKQDVMVCGGAEEMHVMHAGVFDLLFAASSGYNGTPEQTPRPFDSARDGLVVGEGAGTLVLEELEHAQDRGANILAELIGYATNCDGSHITAPSLAGMATVMELALRDAEIEAADVDYINAHATATEVGDIVESLAVDRVLGRNVPISSTKGHTGHTLGACGAIEAAFCIGMLRGDFVPFTRNLENPDERCAPLDYVQVENREIELRTIMNNNFAFGGINTSMLIRRFER